MILSPRSTAAVLLTLVIALLAPTSARAEEVEEKTEQSHFLIETDPTAFLLKGYSVHLGVKPAGLPQWRFWAGSFGSDFPHFLVTAENKADWRVAFRPTFLVGAHRYFGSRGRGFFAGSSAMFMRMRYSRTDGAGSADVDYLVLVPQAGYQWFPFDMVGVYAMPWAGAGFAVHSSGTPSVGSKTYADTAFLPVAALHLGYEL